MSAIDKFLEDYNPNKQQTPIRKPEIISLTFYQVNGKAKARYNDGEQVIENITVNGKAHAYELAEKAKKNAKEQNKRFHLSDGLHEHGPAFSDEAWNELYHTFCPQAARKLWA